MALVWIIIGGFIGAAIGDESGGFFGMLAGIAIAWLLHANHELRKRLSLLAQSLGNLETVVRALQVERRQQRQAEPRPAADAPPAAAPLSKPKPALDDPDRYGTRPAAMPGKPAAQPAAPAAAAMAGPAVAQRDPSDAAAARNDPLDELVERAKRWLTTGNVPVKLGVIVSFFGVGFLLKYAVDNNVIEIPIGMRYLFVAAAAIVLLVFGWRLRERNRVYALSLQGGGVGILYLTIFAAFSLHDVLPAGFAFLLMVLLTIATGALAVVQEARALAILGVVGGFLAPVLISTGTGNHVALFSYYLVLNGAVLGIAWHKAWRGLNIIGFVFTFGVGSLWGSGSYTPEKFWTTEPFLVAYFVFYTAIAILFSLRQPPQLRGIIDGTLVFGTPAIAFALQSLLVEDTEYGLAISAAAVAVFYALLALWLYRTRRDRMRLLVQSFAALAVAFGTVAIPLALSDRWTSVAWALEGAALVWVGVRQGRLLAKLTGTLLAFASGIVFLDYGWDDGVGLPLLNANVLGGVLISVASLYSARLLGTDGKPVDLQPIASVSLMLWGLTWWLSTGTLEILDRAASDLEIHLVHGFFAASFAALGYWAMRKNWVAARRASLCYLFAVLVMGAGYLVRSGHFLVGPGLLAWPAAFIAHLAVLRMAEPHDGNALKLEHLAGGIVFSLLLGYEAWFRTDEANLAALWLPVSTILVFLVLVVGIQAGGRRIEWPLVAYRDSYATLCESLMAIVFVLLLGVSFNDAGTPDPLPYLPLLNPLDLLILGTLYLAARRWSLNAAGESPYSPLLLVWAALAFVLTTLGVVRMVFHFSNLIWDWDVLLDADSIQAALSIYWAILGLGGMIVGARHARRRIWIAGVVLMVLVVLKLFMIDFGNTGTVARIVSFIGVGALLLVVGYFAPAPPRAVARDGT